MAIVLRDAFRYQNFLDGILAQVQRHLGNRRNVSETTEEHLRSKTYPDAQDETRTDKADRVTQIEVDTIIAFATRLFEEKMAVSKAINNAKAQHCPTLDMDIAVNKVRNNLVSTFKEMNSIKEKTTLAPSAGTGRCFNAEGNQTTYLYDIKSTVKPDFDVKALKVLIREMSDEATTISNAIDYWRASVPVDFEPKYDSNSTFLELLEEYSNSVNAR